VCDFHPASDGKRAKGITYISGSRIFSALEVAGDIFSRADVGQQLVEPRRRALQCLLICVRSSFQHLIQAPPIEIVPFEKAVEAYTRVADKRVNCVVLYDLINT
jgi:hypothetical protein